MRMAQRIHGDCSKRCQLPSQKRVIRPPSIPSPLPSGRHSGSDWGPGGRCVLVEAIHAGGQFPAIRDSLRLPSGIQNSRRFEVAEPTREPKSPDAVVQIDRVFSMMIDCMEVPEDKLATLLTIDHFACCGNTSRLTSRRVRFGSYFPFRKIFGLVDSLAAIPPLRRLESKSMENRKNCLACNMLA